MLTIDASKSSPGRASSASRTRLLLLVGLLVTCVPVALSPARPASASTPLALGAIIDNPCDGAALDTYASLVGRMPALVMNYQSWGEYWNSFPTRCMDTAWARHSMMVWTWDSNAGNDTDPQYKDSAIAAGTNLLPANTQSGAISFDTYVTQWALAAKAWGHPFFLRFDHEMNGNWYGWGTGPGNPLGNTPDDFVAAWRHVQDIFAAVGATNVRWVWAPNTLSHSSPLDTTLADYPGDNYVDQTGFSAYNTGATGQWHEWVSLASLSTPIYNALTQLTTKPVMLCETASAEPGGDKAAWITQGLLTDLPSLFPRIDAVVWFDKDKETDWRVDSSFASLSAFRSVVASPLYQGEGAG